MIIGNSTSILRVSPSPEPIVNPVFPSDSSLRLAKFSLFSCRWPAKRWLSGDLRALGMSAPGGGFFDHGFALGRWRFRPCRQCRHRGPARGIRRQDAVVAMPVSPWWRNQGREPVEQLVRGEQYADFAAVAGFLALIDEMFRVERAASRGQRWSRAVTQQLLLPLLVQEEQRPRPLQE